MWQHVAKLFKNVFVLLTTLQMSLAALELSSRQRALNSTLSSLWSPPALEELCGTLLGGITRDHRGRLKAPRLRQLTLALTTLRKAAQHLQRHFGPAAAFAILYSVAGVTYSAYEVVVMKDAKELLVNHSLYWFGLHCYRLLLLVLSWSSVAEEAEKSCALIHDVAALSTSPEMDALLRQVDRPPVRLTAAGFFTIDRGLLLSVVAAIFTYLTVLHQLSID